MITYINKILWAITTVFIIGGGIYFTFLFKGIQFRFIDMFKGFKHKENTKISPFETLMMSTAARVGVGSLAGVALAIYIGGIGTIFWIFISAIITAPNSFVESCLAMIYKEKDGEYYTGGPSFYIKKGLGKQKLASLYAVLLMFAYIVGFLTIQSNTIVVSLKQFANFNNILVGTIIVIITGLIIFKGLKGIVNITGKIVPVMCIGYLLVCLFIIIKNFSVIPSITSEIVNHAFNIKSFGIGVLTSFIIGIQRGVFSNEAGLGTGSIAASTTDSNNIIGEGMIQIIGVYFTSFIICIGTALIILTSDYTSLNLTNVNGIEITQYALKYHLGSFGELVLVLSILLFSFSTILTGYYYGESGLKFLCKNISIKTLFIFKTLTLILLFLGSVINADVIWKIVDVFVALLAIINIYAIFKLRKIVVYEWDKYTLK